MDSKPGQLLASPSTASQYADSEPPTAVSLEFQEKATLSSTREWTTRPARPRLLGLLPAAAIIVTALGFVVVIVGVLLGFQCGETQGGHGILPVIRKGYFYTVETHDQSPDSKTHLWILFISNGANQFVAGSSSFIMALVAYRVGADWLRLSRSQSSSSPSEAPSPAQYGLLVRLLGSSSISSILDASLYTVRSWKRTRPPRIFRYSLSLAATVWVLARLVGATDAWLHATSSSITSNVTTPEAQTAPARMWGVSFNTSICADMRAKYDGTSEDPLPYDCLEEHEEFIDNEEWGHAMAFQAMTGSANAMFQVGVAEGDTAFVLPGPKYVDMGTKNFVIPTFATRASCTSLNRLCATDATGAISNCTSAGFPEFPYYRADDKGYIQEGWAANRVVGSIDGEIVGLEQGSFESMKTPKNPAQLAVQLQWEQLEQGSVKLKGAAAGATTSEKDLAINLEPRPTLFASCNLTFLDAFVQWNSMAQNWTLLNTTASSDERTSTLWLPLVWQYATEQLAANLMHTARTDSREVVMQALGENIATLALASAAGFFKPGIASDVTQTRKLVVSEYPVPPIVALLVLLLAYALLASTMFLSAYLAPDESIVIPGANRGVSDEEMEASTLTLAQRWLTDPMPLVDYSFTGADGRDGTRSAAYSAINTAHDGNEGPTRLTIGLVGDTFGVTTWGQR